MKNNLKPLLTLGLFTFMSTLDSSIVNIALPTISRELHISFALTTWTINSYLIIIASLLLFFGKLGDIFGKSRIFRIGMLIFSFGSLLAGMNFGMGFNFLLIARCIQATGAAMTLSNSYGITSQIFKPSERSRAMAAIAMFVSLGLIAGPALGGLILQFSSWNMIFMINLPIGIIAYLTGSRSLPKDNHPQTKSKLDFIGLLLFFATITLFFIGLNSYNLPLIVLGSLLFTFFIYWEHKIPSPLLSLNIFSNPLFSLSVGVAIAMFTAGSFSTVLLPYYFQEFRGISTGLTGLLMLGYPLGVLIFSPIAGVLADKFDKEAITMVGISGVLLASVGFLFIGNRTSIFSLFFCLLFYGAAIGFFKSPNNTLIMETVQKSSLGVAGSINSLSNYIGLMFGTTLATISLFGTMSLMGHRPISTYSNNFRMLFLTGLHAAFLLALIIVLIAWLLSFQRFLRQVRVSTHH